MALRLVQVNVKAGNAPALGRFWAAALGWAVSGERPGATPAQPVGFAWPDPAAVSLDVIAVPDPETVHDRVHLELATTSVAHHAESVARLTELGATIADVSVPWTVMADPEGNSFRVLAPRSSDRDTGPIAAVVVACADPRAMARFWGEATDWLTHEVSDDHARLRSVAGVGPYLEFRRASDTVGTTFTWTSRRTRVTTRPPRWPGCGRWAPPTPTSARATCRGRSWPTRRATSSASSPRPDRA